MDSTLLICSMLLHIKASSDRHHDIPSHGMCCLSSLTALMAPTYPCDESLSIIIADRDEFIIYHQMQGRNLALMPSVGRYLMSCSGSAIKCTRYVLYIISVHLTNADCLIIIPIIILLSSCFSKKLGEGFDYVAWLVCDV